MKHITVLTYRYAGSDKLYTVKSEIGGRKLEKWFNTIKTKTNLLMLWDDLGCSSNLVEMPITLYYH